LGRVTRQGTPSFPTAGVWGEFPTDLPLAASIQPQPQETYRAIRSSTKRSPTNSPNAGTNT